MHSPDELRSGEIDQGHTIEINNEGLIVGNLLGRMPSLFQFIDPWTGQLALQLEDHGVLFADTCDP